MNQQSKFKQTEIGIIPEGWEVRKIKEVGKVITGKTPSSKNPEYFGGGILFVTPTDFKNYNKNIFDAERRISSLGEQKHKNQILPTNSIIVTCIGSDMGKIAITKVKCLTNQQINSIIIEKDYDYNFIYYKLKSIYSHLKLLATSGSTMPIVNKSEFENISLSLPNNSEEQKSIAKILSDLDSKIELLQKQNKTLEAIAQAIFKHWFVDFEFPNEEGKPYKSSGGEMVFNEELGKEIPKGWEVKNLGEFLNVIKGCSYKSEDLKESDKALITLKSINRDGGFNQKGYKEYVGDYKEEQIVKDGDIVVAQTDLTQAAEVIGTPAIVNSLNRYNELIASLDLQILRIKEKLNKGFAYFLLKTAMFHNHALSYTNGTTVLHLNKNAVSDFKFTLPNENILGKFGKIAEQILEKADKNEKEVYISSQIRDSLLPKLMSGEIRVGG